MIEDNGYREWSTTVPPLTTSCNRLELRFSQWLESMRKDVECTFGTLKGRWRALKTGIRLQNTEVSDNIWLTRCVVHNMLFDVDSLNKAWKNGVCLHWEMKSGELRDGEIPFVIHRLIDPNGTDDFRLRHYDDSQFGYRRPPVEVSNNKEDENDNGEYNRNHGNLFLFRSFLGALEISFHLVRLHCSSQSLSQHRTLCVASPSSLDDVPANVQAHVLASQFLLCLTPSC